MTAATRPLSLATSSPYSQIVDVTPSLAKQWLEANTKNRKLRPSLVAKYARAMKKGHWMLTHQGIAFSADNVLVDGQHRLGAIVESGVTVRMTVTRGVDFATQAVVDGGGMRRMADQVGVICDMQIDKSHIAIANVMIRPSANTNSSDVYDMSDFLMKHHDAISFAVATTPRQKGQHGLSVAGVRAVIARAYYHSNHERLAAFGRVLITSMPSGPGDSGALLLYRVLNNNTNTRGRMSPELYGKIERALRAFLDHEPISRLYAATEELFPLPKD